MIFEVEVESRDFLTVYKKDFYAKKTERPPLYKPILNYSPPLNVLNGPYKKCLNTRKQNAALNPSDRTEDPQESINRFHENFPHLKTKVLEVAPNEDIIEREEKKLSSTVYQIDYSKNLDDFLHIRGRRTNSKKIYLPEKWTIQETIQRRSYRNPRDIVSVDFLKRKPISKPLDNLCPNTKQREILRVKTEDSTYEYVFGSTADRIMQEHSMPSLPPSKELKEDSSKCSLVLASKPVVLPSKIF